MAARRRPRRSSSRPLHRLNEAMVSVLLATSVVACDAGEEPDGGSKSSAPGSRDEQQRSVPVPPVRVHTNIDDLRAADIGAPLRIDASQGTLKDVTLETAGGTELPGTLDDGAWLLSSRLEPGTDYVATARAERTDGEVVTKACGSAPRT